MRLSWNLIEVKLRWIELELDWVEAELVPTYFCWKIELGESSSNRKIFLETLLTSKMQGWDTRVRRGQVRGKGGGLRPQGKEYERQKVRHYSDMKLKVSKALLGC